MCEEFDNYDYCYECRGCGDDYSVNDDGELKSNCETCTMNLFNDDWDD